MILPLATESPLRAQNERFGHIGPDHFALVLLYRFRLCPFGYAQGRLSRSLDKLGMTLV